MGEETMTFGIADPLYPQAAALLPADEAMPVSFLQRRLRIGYHRALRLSEAIRGRDTPAQTSAAKAGHDPEAL